MSNNKNNRIRNPKSPQKDLPQKMGIIDEQLKRGDVVLVRMDGKDFMAEITFAPLKSSDLWQVRTYVPDEKGERKPIIMGINPYYHAFAYMLKYVDEKDEKPEVQSNNND